MDHLVYACPDLAEGVRLIQELLGVEASPGGRHEGLGTRNALVGLGPHSYLEIVSVDPDQSRPTRPRWFGLDTLSEARLVTWATESDDLEENVRLAGGVGLDLGAVAAARRRRPDGTDLSWVFTDPRADRLDGIVPFFIDWRGALHPATSIPSACTCEGLAAEHPDAPRVQSLLGALGVDLPVVLGPAPRMIATIDSPNGLIELS